MEPKRNLFPISGRQPTDLFFPASLNPAHFFSPNNHRFSSWLGIVITCASLSGCMGFEAISNEARPGGTVLVAVDAVRHQMPDPARVQATFFDREGAEHAVSLRHLLRVQPDPVSAFGLGQYSTNKGLYAGQKLAIVDLVDPLTQQPPIAPAMASGEGVLELYMPDLEQSSAHTLKILPANALPGLPSNDLRVLHNAKALRPMQTAWMLQASPLPHVRVETIASDVFNSDTQLAGAVFILRYRTQDFAANFKSPGFAITKLSGDPNLQLSWQSNDIGPDHGEL
ncbi:MAG: hypothetical protein HKO06_03090, partial [Pseudomonadales bacterium]|nr:hypothetical protein [Pseudomonadales bacterium]